jgi:hypothetical protein
LNISANSKLCEKTLSGENVAQGKMLDEKTRGKKSHETIPEGNLGKNYILLI